MPSHIMVEIQDHQCPPTLWLRYEILSGLHYRCWTTQNYYRMAHSLSSSTKVRMGAVGNIGALDMCSEYFGLVF
jgi:hypothetical protein